MLLPKIGRRPGTGIRALLFRGDGIAGIGAGVGVLAVVCIVASPRTRQARRAVAASLSGLAVSLLAVLLTAAQVVPCWEFIRQTGRVATGHDVFPFSLEPFRLVEMVWPNAFGLIVGEQSAWAGRCLCRERDRCSGCHRCIWGE